MVMTHTHAKDQGQTSLGSEYVMERQTDGTDCITLHACTAIDKNVVINSWLIYLCYFRL